MKPRCAQIRFGLSPSAAVNGFSECSGGPSGCCLARQGSLEVSKQEACCEEIKGSGPSSSFLYSTARNRSQLWRNAGDLRQRRHLAVLLAVHALWVPARDQWSESMEYSSHRIAQFASFSVSVCACSSRPSPATLYLPSTSSSVGRSCGG